MPDRVEQWLNRFKPVTKSGYTAAANRFQAFFPAGPIGLRDAGQGRANEILADWRQSMIDAGGAAATINQRLAAIRSFLASERRAGRINWTPDVKNMPYEPYRDTQGPGREVIQKMIAFCDSSYRGRRNAVLIRLLHDLALRS